TGDNSTTVTFAKTSGAGTVTGLRSATVANGVASLTVTGDVAGAITIDASVSGLTGDSTAFTVVPGAATKIVVTSGTADLASGATRTLTAEIRDANDNLVTSDNSTSLTFAKTTGAGTLTGLGSATATNGVVSLTVTGKDAGAITVGATGGSLTGDSTSFTVVPGAAAKVVVTSGTADLASGSNRTLTAEIRDANDNVLTGDNSTSVTFAKASGAGTLTGLGSATASNGVASLTVTGDVAGAITIDATSGSLTSDSTTFTVVPGAATKVVVTSGTVNLASGSNRTLTAEIRDANDNLVTGDSATVVTFTKTSGAGTVTGLGDATASNGIASLTVTGNVAGAITVDATAGSLTDDSTSFTVVPGAAAKVVVTSGTGNLASGATRTLTAEIRDANDNVETSDNSTTVTFAKSSGAGTVTGLGDATASNGIATLTVTGNVAGAITVDATAGSLTDDSTTFTVVPGAAAKVVVTSDASNIASGATKTLTAEIRDANDNVLTGDNSTTVTFAKTSGAGTVTGLGDATAANGVASLTVTGKLAGAIAIGATSGSLAADSTGFTITPGAAAKVVVTSGTGNLASGATRTLTAEIRDANDNLVGSDSSTSVAFAKTTGAGTVTGLGSATAANGVASLTVTGQTAGPITVGATAGSLTGDTSSFTVVAGAASTITSTVTVGSPTLTADGTSTTTVTVHAKDANGNTITAGGDLVTLSSSHGSLGSVTDNNDGTYTATLTAPTTVSTASIGGTLDGLPLTASATVGFVPGPAAAVVITSNGSSIASGTTKSLTAEIRDANGNLETGDSSTVVTFAKTSGAGTVTGLGTAIASNGVATLTVTGNVAGAITIAATSGSLTSDSTTFTITPGTAAKLVITSGTGNLGWNVTRTLTAEIRDANDNVVTGDSSTVVTFAKTSGLGTVTGLGTATASNGVASLDVVGATPGGITIDASSGSLTNGSTSFGIVTGSVSAGGSTNDAAPAAVTADGASTATITVTLVDGGGNPIVGKTVTLTQNGGAHSTISAASGPSDASGVVTFTVHDDHAETVTYTAADSTDAVTLTHASQVVFQDLNPPAATIGAPASAVDVAGSLTLNASGVSDGETGVHDVAFDICDSTASSCDPVTSGASHAGTDGGSGSWTASLDTTTLTTGHTYTWAVVATDNAGNQTTTASRTFTVDNTVPATAVAAPTFLTGAGAQFWNGPTSTLWLRGGAAGSFQLNQTASDAESGIAKVGFPAILGTSANDSTTPVAGTTYRSSTYSFNNQPTDITPVTGTATNGVTAGTGANTASDSLGIRVDSTAPTATIDSSLDGKVVAGSILVSAGSNDGGSGVASVAFAFCDRTVNPVCSPSLAIGTDPTGVAGVYSKSWDTTALVDGHAYAVAATATDNVGNVTTSSIATVTVDNSAPTVAMTTPSTSGNAYFDGTTLFVKATGTGSYTLGAHATDADSGISAVHFGSDLGTNGGSGNYTSPAYAFDGTTTPVGSSTATVTADNGVQTNGPLTSSDTLSIVADATAPTSASQFPVDNGGYDSNTFPTGSQDCTGSQPEGLCGTVTDTGSGVASVKLTLQDLGGGKYFDGTGFSNGVTTLDASVNGNTWSYALAHSKLSSGTFELKVYGIDNVGNVESTHTIDFQYGDDLTPPDTQLTLKNATHAYLASAGSHVSPNAGYDYVLYYSTAGNGGFTLHAVSTDVSGIDHIDFPGIFGTGGATSNNGSAASPWAVDSPAYTFGSSDTTAPGQKNVVSVDTAIPHANTGNDTLTFLVDNAAPTGGSITAGPIAASGYATQTNLTVSHVDYADAPAGSGLASSVLTVASASLGDGACGTFGSDAPVTDGAFTATNGTCYRFTLTGTDNVGNVSTVTQTVKVDTTAPVTPSVVFSGLSTGNTYDDGAGTLWYRPSAGGTFTVTATATDAESGIGTYTYSSLLGGTQTAGRLDTTFGAGGIGSGSYTVHATNRAGLDSGDAHFSVNADSTPPVNGALKVNGTDAAAIASSSYLTTGPSVSIDSRVDYTDADSGLQSSTLTVESATLSHDSCGTWSSPQTITGSSYGVSNGNCYRFTLTGTDNVGNTASISTVVKVDTTPPTTPSVSFSGLSAGNTYDDGNGKLWYRPSAAGTFTVTASGATDPETDIKSGNAGYTFSTLSGFLSSTQTGNHVDLTFDGSSNGGGAYSVVATNNAGVDSSPAPFTVAADSTAPTNGLLSINPWSSSLTVSIGEQDFADAGSGIAGNVLTRSNPLPATNGTCPANGYSGSTNVALSGGAATDTVPTDGSCYEYTLTGTDNVGNSATYQTIVLVDTTPATGGMVEAPDGLTSLDKISVDWNAGTDPQSGVSQVDVLRADASLSGSTCGAFGGFNTIVTNASTNPIVDSSVSAGNCYQYEIRVKNGAGVWATFTSSATTKLTNASPIAVASTAGHTYLAGSTLWMGPGASTFGLQLTGVGANGVDTADWSATAGSLSGTAVTANTGAFPSSTYTWDGTSPLSATITVTRQPTASVDSLTVQSDTTAPSGSIVYANGPNTTHSVPVSTSGVGDGESGVAGVQILRSQTTLTGSTCDTASWTAFAPVTLSGGNDTTVADEHCYQYEAVITDNVGNTTTATSANVVQIPDITPPTFGSASTNAAGTQLTITMSEGLDTTSVPGAGRWVVLYNGVAQPSPTGVHLAGNQVVLDLPSAPDNGQTVTVRYL
ncbi:MAG: invasin domain 3-containing protein, partial [Actinomycetota bacterium]